MSHASWALVNIHHHRTKIIFLAEHQFHQKCITVCGFHVCKGSLGPLWIKVPAPTPHLCLHYS